ncbi:hypothetical protein ACIBF6_43740 [Streptosporangium amethystogenes]|uniref:hypothetical protein n=1 Tax=Streptosporangium amethystogenes TaxID=2002 RepID=UPI00379C4E96
MSPTTGCSWEEADWLCGTMGSDTPLGRRRDERIATDAVAIEVRWVHDRVKLFEAAVEGCPAELLPTGLGRSTATGRPGRDTGHQLV